MNYEKIYAKKEKLIKNQHKISSEVMARENAAFKVEFTHNSTAIEGNTLTLLQTKVVLEDKLSVDGKPLREIYEVVNNNKAMEFVEKCIDEKLELNEAIIKDIHAIINENIFQGGIYRSEPVRISGASHKPPSAQEMFAQVKNSFADLDYKTELNPIEFAAWTHAEFVRIHPFVDGNGRTSRLIMNYQLMSKGFPAISISKNERFKYYEALDKYASENNLTAFSEFLAALVEKRLDELLELIPN